MAVSENEAQEGSTLDTSAQSKLPTTKTASKSTRRKATSPSDKLRILQAALNEVDTIKGVAVRQTIIFDAGNQALAIVLYGIGLDDAGNLIFNAGKKD